MNTNNAKTDYTFNIHTEGESRSIRSLGGCENIITGYNVTFELSHINDKDAEYFIEQFVKMLETKTELNKVKKLEEKVFHYEVALDELNSQLNKKDKEIKELERLRRTKKKVFAWRKFNG